MESIDSIYTEVCSSNNNKEAYKVLQTWAYENHSGSDVLDVLKALMCPLFWFFSAKMILSLSPGLAHLKFFGSEKEKISNSKEIENSNGAFKLRCKKLCYVTSPNESSTFIFRILFEGLFVIVPLLVALMHSQWTWFCLILSLLFGLFLVLLTAQERNTDLIIGDLNSEFKTFISEFRSLMMIFVVASILAVDFTTFPRRFAKTESYGFSLMDAGVGIFIISNSIVAGRKTHYSWGLSQRLTSAVRSTLPLLILGFTRLVTVKAVNYQEHVTEYGVHWNFFFTIFFVTLFSTLLNFFMRQSFLTLLSTFILFVYQFCLELLNLSFYIINAPRYTNFFSMNREGFCGLCGFFFLYTCGLQLGSFLLKPRTVRDWKFLVLQLAALDLFLWLALLGVIYLGGLAPSRRLVNLPYVLFILSISVFLLGSLLVCQLCLVKRPVTLFLIDLVNQNLLLVFLFANLLTGCTNLLFRTLCFTSCAATTYVLFYILALFAFAALLLRWNIKEQAQHMVSIRKIPFWKIHLFH